MSTSSTTTASAITRGSATGSSTRLSMDHEEAVRSNAARGSVGFFGTTAEPRRARLSFGTIRGIQIGTIDVILARLCIRHELQLLSRPTPISGASQSTNRSGAGVRRRAGIRLAFDSGFHPTLVVCETPPTQVLARRPAAERFVRSIKSDCLAQVIPIGEGHLRRAVAGEYVEHYHGKRNHQGMGNQPIEASADDSRRHGPIERRERLGGLLRFYCRGA